MAAGIWKKTSAFASLSKYSGKYGDDDIGAHDAIRRFLVTYVENVWLVWSLYHGMKSGVTALYQELISIYGWLPAWRYPLIAG